MTRLRQEATPGKAGWNDKTTARAKFLWLNEGLSAAQIADRLAAEFNAGLSRNAVIGKMHRMGLAGRGQPVSSRPRRRTYRTRRARAVASVVGKRVSELEARPKVAAPIARKLTIFQLTERTCKWPIGDPLQEDFCFCGHDAVEELPYCEYHAGIAYQTPPPAKGRGAPNARGKCRAVYGSARSGAWA